MSIGPVPGTLVNSTRVVDGPAAEPETWLATPTTSTPLLTRQKSGGEPGPNATKSGRMEVVVLEDVVVVDTGADCTTGN